MVSMVGQMVDQKYDIPDRTAGHVDPRMAPQIKSKWCIAESSSNSVAELAVWISF